MEDPARNGYSGILKGCHPQGGVFKLPPFLCFPGFLSFFLWNPPPSLKGFRMFKGMTPKFFKKLVPCFLWNLMFFFQKETPKKCCVTSLLPHWRFASLDGSHHHRSFNRKRPLQAMPSLWVGIWKSTRNVFATAFLPGVAQLGHHFFFGWKTQRVKGGG